MTFSRLDTENQGTIKINVPIHNFLYNSTFIYIYHFVRTPKRGQGVISWTTIVVQNLNFAVWSMWIANLHRKFTNNLIELLQWWFKPQCWSYSQPVLNKIYDLYRDWMTNIQQLKNQTVNYFTPIQYKIPNNPYLF